MPALCSASHSVPASAEGFEGFPACVSPGTFRGVCKKIDHFPEDADYEQDTAEYLLRESAFPWQGGAVRAPWGPHASLAPPSLSPSTQSFTHPAGSPCC